MAQFMAYVRDEQGNPYSFDGPNFDKEVLVRLPPTLQFYTWELLMAVVLSDVLASVKFFQTNVLKPKDLCNITRFCFQLPDDRTSVWVNHRQYPEFLQMAIANNAQRLRVEIDRRSLDEMFSDKMYAELQARYLAADTAKAKTITQTEPKNANSLHAIAVLRELDHHGMLLDKLHKYLADNKMGALRRTFERKEQATFKDNAEWLAIRGKLELLERTVDDMGAWLDRVQMDQKEAAESLRQNEGNSKLYEEAARRILAQTKFKTHIETGKRYGESWWLQDFQETWHNIVLDISKFSPNKVA